jgi:hypothetical protein
MTHPNIGVHGEKVSRAVPKKTIKATLAEGRVPELRGGARLPAVPAAYRREQAVRTVLRKYGDPLQVMAQVMAEAAQPVLDAAGKPTGQMRDATMALNAAKALGPYMHAQHKAVELSSPDGTAGVTVQVVSLARTAPERVQLPQAVVVDALPPKPE